MPFVHGEVLAPVQDYKCGLNERRAHVPFDIDITSIHPIMRVLEISLLRRLVLGDPL